MARVVALLARVAGALLLATLFVLALAWACGIE